MRVGRNECCHFGPSGRGLGVHTGSLDPHRSMPSSPSPFPGRPQSRRITPHFFRSELYNVYVLQEKYLSFCWFLCEVPMYTDGGSKTFPGTLGPSP